MPGFRWEMVHNVALAKEVATRHPQKLVDWAEIAEKLSSAFSTKEKPIRLKGRGCKDRLDLLLKKYKDEDAKSLKNSGTEEEYSELEQLLEDISTYLRELAKAKSAEQTSAAQKINEDKRKGEAMRKAAMEGISNLSSSSSSSIDPDEVDEDQPSFSKKPRFMKDKVTKQTGKSAAELMQAKFETRAQLKREELEIHKAKVELQKQKLDIEKEEREKTFELEQQERKALIALLLKHAAKDQ